MNFQDWERSVPADITEDRIWRMGVCWLALSLTDICWPDVTKLNEDRGIRSLADQLYRSVGSVWANIAEGYSRESGRDRARFYEYALGAAREARKWY